VSADAFGKRIVWERSEHASPTATKKGPERPMLVIFLGALVAALVLGVYMARRDTMAPSPCNSGTDIVDQMRGAIGRGETSYAQRTIDGQLSNQAVLPLCASAQATLAGFRYTAAMNEALAVTSSAGGTSDAGHQALLKWLEAEQFADSHAIPPEQRTPPMTVYSTAYSIGAWELTRAAFLKGWGNGVAGPTNLKMVDGYYATLVNLGLQNATSSRSAVRESGLRLLYTADRIARRYDLPGRGEARESLIRFLGSDESTWPEADLDDPVLAAAPKT